MDKENFNWKEVDPNHVEDALHHDDAKDMTLQEAMAEAQRCLHCAKPLCRTGCPIENEIPDFIHAIAQGNFGEAREIIGHRSNLPAICGRVCPKEKQCEGACILNRAKKPIRIGQLERFAADFVAEMGVKPKKKPLLQSLGKIAVIGSGPAGLTVAGDLSKLGYEVTVFEAQSEPGGILIFGIPEFRLGKHIVRREIDALRQLGVTFRCDTMMGRDITLDEIFAQGFEAVFIGIGTSVPTPLNVPNVDKEDVLNSMSVLHAVQYMQNTHAPAHTLPIQKGDQVIVVGAGNVAIDVARTSLRLGADVRIVYRRGQANMSCLPSEFDEAKEEGVQFSFYSAPVEVLGDERVRGLRVEKQEIQEDGSMVPTGVYEEIPCNKLIVAIGHKPNTELLGAVSQIETSEEGYIKIQEEPYGMTSRAGVFAAGDIVHKPATVVLAMREAKKVVEGIVQYMEERRFAPIIEESK